MSTVDIPTNKIKAFHHKVYDEADETIKKFIFGYFLLGVGISFFNNTWLIGLGFGGFFFIAFLLLRSRFKNTAVYRYFIGFLMWNFPLQFMLQMHGMYEVTFFYFISLTVLLFYEDWKVLMPTTVYAILTLGSVYYLQQSDYNTEYLSESRVFDVTSFAIHLALLIFYSGLCILWSIIQRNQTHESGLSQIEMEDKLKFMEANIAFADTISNGDLNAEYSLETSDELGKSLMDMRSSLVDASKREEREKFINVGLARVSEILRNHVNDLNILCDKVIEELVNYLKTNQGGIFIINDDQSKPVLELKASRAFERKKYLEKQILPGQGLVGQCFLEKSTILITDVPDNYVNITSGLGKANPRAILIVPLINNEEIVGVIEFASFKKFTPLEVEFLEKVGESIASTVLSAKNNQKTISLLEESDLMTEQMKAQEEEMRQNMEELQATQEEMERTQTELKIKESNIRSLIFSSVWVRSISSCVA